MTEPYVPYGPGSQYTGFDTYIPPEVQDPTSIGTMRTRLGETNQIAANPLSAPGIQQIIATLGAQLARRAASQRESALARAAASGQGGFQGAIGDVAANIESAQAETLAGQTADITTKVFEQARAEGASITEAISRAQAETNRLKVEREQIIAAQKIEAARVMLEQAQQAERIREFGVEQEFKQKELATQSKQFEEGFGLEQEKFGFQQEEFAKQQALEEQKVAQQKQEFEAAQKQQQEQFAKDLELKQQELEKQIEQQTFAKEQTKKEFELQQEQFGFTKEQAQKELSLKELSLAQQQPARPLTLMEKILESKGLLSKNWRYDGHGYWIDARTGQRVYTGSATNAPTANQPENKNLPYGTAYPSYY